VSCSSWTYKKHILLAKKDTHNGITEHCRHRKTWVADIEHTTEERDIQYEGWEIETNVN
jgi:hypothetical protein